VLEVSNTALHNFPLARGLKEEITNENQDQRKIFEPGGICYSRGEIMQGSIAHF